MTERTREQARAVVLAALMVLSVMVGTIALSGSAAATASGVDFDGQSSVTVQGGEDITITGDVTANDQDVTIYVDDNDNGNKNSGETLTTVSASSISDGSFEVTTAAPDEADLENPSSTTVWVIQGASISNQASYSANADEQVGTLTVDDTPVSFNSASPTSTVTTSTPDIRQNITDAVSGVNADSIEVTITQDGSVYYTYAIGSETSNDGVDFSNNNVTITPGQGNVPELADGDYTVDITAADEAGNSGNTQFGFSVDTADLSFDLTSPTAETTVGSPTQPVSVDVIGSSTQSANLTLTNQSGYSATVDDESGAYTSGTFDVVPGTTTGVSELPNGTITVEVNATDTAGNYNETSYTFEVDNIKPNADTPVLSSTEINTQNDAGDETLTVTFDEPVDASTVQATVSDGAGNTVTIDSANLVEDEDGTEVVFNFDVSGLSATTNQSAEVEVTAGQDLYGNTLNNTPNTTFAIDTERPTVTVNQIGTQSGVVSGYVNLTKDVTVTGDDVESVEYYALPGGDGAFNPATDEGDLVTLSAPSNLDTTAVPEGSHTLVVVATDNASNANYDTTELVVDNAEPTISYDQNAILTGTVDISEFLTVENAGGAVTYQYNYNSNGWTDAEEFNVNDKGEGSYELRALVEDDGYEALDNEDTLTTVTLPGRSLDLINPDTGLDSAAEGFTATANGDGTVTINVTTDVQLDGLNVSVETDDSYIDQGTTEASLGDFEQVDSANGFKYTLTIDAPRDGAYKFTFENASAQMQMLESNYERDVEVDAGDASVIDADVSNGGASQLTVNVTFDEPVAQSTVDASDFSVAERSTSAIAVSDTAAQGYVEVTFDSEFQTGDGPTLEVAEDGVTEVYGDDPSAAQSETIDTVELDLQQGINVVSVPAEAGSTQLDDVVDSQYVESVWAYDDGEWHTYAPGASDNSLTSLNGGQGYLVVASQDVSWDLSVYNVPSATTDSGPTAPASENVEAGWNLLGHYQEGDQSSSKALTTVDTTPNFANGNVVTTLAPTEGYNFVEANTLNPGEGYWVFVEESDIYAAVDYDDADTIAPTISNVDVTQQGADDIVQDGETVKVTADVTNVNSVTVDASPIGGPDALTMPVAGGTASETFTVGSESTPTASDGQVSLTVTATSSDGAQVYGSDTITYDADDLSTSIDVQLADDDSVVVNVTSNEDLSTLDVTNDANLGGDLAIGDFTEQVVDGTYYYTATPVDSASDDTDYTASIGSAVDANNTADTDSGASDTLSIGAAGDAYNDPSTNPVSAQPSTTVSNLVIEYDVAMTAAEDDGDTDTFYLTLPSEFVSSGSQTNTLSVNSVTVDSQSVNSPQFVDRDGDQTAETLKWEYSYSDGGSDADVTADITVETPSSTGTYDFSAKTVTSQDNVYRTSSAASLEVTDAPITGASIASTSTDSDQVYTTGETISVDVSFDETVTVDTNGGTPALDIGLGSATYDSGSGSQTLTFTYTVSDGDSGPVTLGDISLNGGSITDPDSNSADLTTNGVSLSTSASADTAAQFSSAATASTSTIDVTFTETVTASDSTGFTVTVNGQQETIDTAIGGSGTDTLTLTLSSYTIQTGDTITVSYDGSGDVTDDDSDAVVTFSDESVTNNV